MPAVALGAEGEEQVGMDVDGAGKLVVESSGVPGFCSTGLGVDCLFRLLDWFPNFSKLKHLRFSANKDHQTPPPGFDWESCIFDVKACIEKDACGKRLFLSDSRFFFTQHRCWPLHPKQMTLNHRCCIL